MANMEAQKALKQQIETEKIAAETKVSLATIEAQKELDQQRASDERARMQQEDAARKEHMNKQAEVDKEKLQQRLKLPFP